MATAITADFKAYQERVTATLMNVTRNAGAVASQDLSFHRSVSDKVSRALDAQNTHFLRLTNKLLKVAAKETSIKAPNLQDSDTVDDGWRGIVDVIDDLLEKADANLDEFNGVFERQNTPPQTPTPGSTPANLRSQTYRAMPHNVTMPKPQLHFRRAVQNFNTDPWRPLLTTKPHAKVPLEESIENTEIGHKHPYQQEIELYKYPTTVYQESTPISYTHPDNSQPVFVDTEEGVVRMLEELRHAKEIAIDLEHNDKNSYVGLVSLMQISTRSRDWVVDTLKPWREDLQILNQVFADPSILKVFHGSTSDMVWLQRDLGLYVVGLFDTYHAACALQYPGKGLAYLLERFADFKAQKQHQLADWRVRPLPKELLDYARADTHYLLYIYDMMRNELVAASTSECNLVDYVLEHSKRECLQVYERHAYDKENGLGSDGYLKLLLTRNTKVLDKQQFGVLRALHEWRDRKARELDEGVSSIMSNNYLFNCAEFMPMTKSQYFGNRSLGRASPYVTQYMDEIVATVKQGKREGLEGPTVQEVMDRNADKLSMFTNFKKLNPNAKPQHVQRSVAETMQQLIQNAEVQNGVAAEDSNSSEAAVVRAKSSTFWGPLPPVQEERLFDPTTAQQALMSMMPLQNVVVPSYPPSTIPAEQQGTAEDVAIPSTNGEVRIVQEPDIEVPFTLRDRKNKRPADELEAEDDHVLTAAATDEPERFAVTDEGNVLRRSDARRAFKEAKKNVNGGQPPDLTPFDYANAQDMLSARQPEPLSTYTKPKVFNPFAKALDTTTGARRNKYGKEMAGKSHTFKS